MLRKQPNPKVLLINPNRMKPPVAPLGLEYLGAYLESQGIKAELLDLCWEEDPLQATAERLRKTSYMAIGISVRNTDDCCFATRTFVIPEVRELIKHIRTMTEAPVVLGGCGFSLMPEAAMERCDADIGVVGDGEIAMAKLCKAIAGHADYRAIPGLVYRENGRLKLNRPEIADLGAVAHEFKRGFVDNLRYLEEGGQAGIETKRGCDRNCIYCADPVAKGKIVRVRSVENVLTEIEELVRAGVNWLHLCDSEFNLVEDHCYELCDGLVRSGLARQISWYTYASPKPFSLSLARLMRDAGCVGVNFGVDSASPKILATLGRDFGPEEVAAVSTACKEAGIACMLDLLIGGPGETWETVAETIGFVKKLEVTAIGISLGVRIYPNTVLSEIVYEQGVGPHNPNLHGKLDGNESFLEPVFYLSSALGSSVDEIERRICELVGNDKRFLFMSKRYWERNYNYAANISLAEAIKSGYRGAYWHILRKLINSARTA